jgi:hypothetical protein
MKSSHVALLGLIWLAAAIAAGASGLTAELRPPWPQVVLAGLTAAVIAAGVFVRPFRRWALAADLRVVVGLHLTRFVGLEFLALSARGELPSSFAVPAGVGDVGVAVLAGGLLATVRPEGTWGRRMYLVWNGLGLLDILGVVASAAAHGLADPGSMAPLVRLPLSLLPTFLVPLIISSHALLAVRLLADRKSSDPEAETAHGKTAATDQTAKH